MRTIVIGDIHGRINSLIGVLELSKYNPQNDRLICIGDYVDGGAKAYEVVDYLLELDDISERVNIFILGNHDKLFLDILEFDFESFRDRKIIEEIHWEWYNNGGMATYNSYLSRSDEDIIRHKNQFFNKLSYYYEEDNKLFVHAGYDFNTDIKKSYDSKKEELLWDRHLYKSSITDHSDSMKKSQYGGYNKIILDILQPLFMEMIPHELDVMLSILTKDAKYMVS